jgi:hypothetical protein
MKTKMVALTAIGFLYGTALSVIGFLATGLGHGTYVILGISSAPLGFMGFLVSLFSPPLAWAIIGCLLSKSEYPHKRLFFLITIACHYLSIWPLLATQPFEDLDHFKRTWQHHPDTIIAGICCYLVGQSIMWVYFLRQIHEGKKNNGRLTTGPSRTINVPNP